METHAEHRIDQSPSRSELPGDPGAEALAADTPLPEARVSEDQLQAARRIVEREVRELRAQLARDAAGAPSQSAERAS